MDIPDQPRRDAPSRRDFVRAAGAASLWPALGADRPPDGETTVARFFHSLSDRQKAAIVFPDDHPLRQVAREDWKVVEPSIADLSDPQRALCRQILRGICTPEGFDRLLRVMDDDGGGFDNYHVALFGAPVADRPFEWVLTGPHLTIRASGHRDGAASSGGPWYFGHSARDRNAWAAHARRAGDVFAALDRDQRSRALVTRAQRDANRERSLRGDPPSPTGISMADLDGRGRILARAMLSELISPFGDAEVPAIAACLDPASPAIAALSLTFFEGDRFARGMAHSTWRLDGPAFSWLHHGEPHAHSWVRFAAPHEGP